MGKPDDMFLALGSRLRGVPEILTLGVKPNFLDYPAEDRMRMLDAPIIFYPTRTYAQFFTTLQTPIFPSLETYLYADEKLKQTTLFQMLGISHPRTRFYYPRHHGDILRDFDPPFVAKLPRDSARGRGVFKITGKEELNAYLKMTKVAYIQEFIPHDKDLRVVLINYQPVLSYWRIRGPRDFRTNLHQGGRIGFEGIPEKAVFVAQEAARRCRFNDVGLDLIHRGDTWYVIEANMKYGRKAMALKGLDLKTIMRRKIRSGELTGGLRRGGGRSAS